jgi:hypothetical protein
MQCYIITSNWQAQNMRDFSRLSGGGGEPFERAFLADQL